MTRYDTRARLLAICLATLAGYVDAIGFIVSGGFFVSFMSGNSTRFAVGISGYAINAAVAAGLIAAFVIGVCAGALIGHAAGRRRRPVVLAFVAALLATAASADLGGLFWLVIAPLALAMGAENAVFERDGDVGIGLTYMTGSLVRIGYGLAGLLTGQAQPGWTVYLALWAGLVVGAIAGALAYPQLGAGALWLASGLAVLLAAVAMAIQPKPA
jgi:uncharacterized membrane protein YoaK (UPF0700 family)